MSQLHPTHSNGRQRTPFGRMDPHIMFAKKADIPRLIKVYMSNDDPTRFASYYNTTYTFDADIVESASNEPIADSFCSRREYTPCFKEDHTLA